MGSTKHDNLVIVGAVIGALIGFRYGIPGIVVGGFIGAILVEIFDKG